MQTLQDDFSQVSASIPAYSRRQAADTIALLIAAVAATRARVFPPSRFSFYPDSAAPQQDTNTTETTDTAPTAAAAHYADAAQVDELVASALAQHQPGDSAAPPPTSALAPDLISASSVPDIAGVSNAVIVICGSAKRAAGAAQGGAQVAAELIETEAVPSRMLDTYLRWLAHTRERAAAAGDAVDVKESQPMRYLLVRGDFGGRDLWLSQLRDCVVCVLSPLVALRANDLQRVLLLAGPVAGSAHAERLQDCLFAVACRQIRIHHARNVDFSLSAQSNPIIEHSSCCRFWPYALSYPSLREHCEAARLSVALLDNPIAAADDEEAWRLCEAAAEDSTTTSTFPLPATLVRADDASWGADEAGERKQLWAAVDDFNWLRTQQSPNWNVCLRTHRWARLEGVEVRDIAENKL